MAVKSKDIYGRYGVYGSLAYDFKTSHTFPEDAYSVISEKKKKNHRKKTKSPALLVSCILTAALLFTGVMLRSSMVVLSEEVYSLRNEVENLLEEQTKLKISHEKAFPLQETEKYAIEFLGMQKPMPYQIIYIDVDELKEETLISGEEKNINFFSFLREYFPL